MTDWRRVPVPALVVAVYPNTRMWQKDVRDGHLTAMKTIEPTRDRDGWRIHLSISHRTNELPAEPGRYPTWDEQKEAVYRFAPGKHMASYLPAEGSPYVNVHPTTFHWWEVDNIEEIE